jgi:hypothetical protein
MTFAAPLLLLTTLLPLVLLGYELLRLRRDRETAPARILGGSAAHGVVRLSRSTPAASPRRLLVCLGLILVGVAAARPQDLVLIAGKGHEDYQILGTTKVHFDDREEAARALQVRVAG